MDSQTRAEHRKVACARHSNYDVRGISRARIQSNVLRRFGEERHDGV
jgi:hypothetical protein